jgi:hypothetical protein
VSARDLDALTEETESEPAQYACAICGRLREAHSTFLTTGLLTCERIACRKRARTLDADFPAPAPPRRARPAARRRQAAEPVAAQTVDPSRPRAVQLARGAFVPPPINTHALMQLARAEGARLCSGCGHAASAHRGRVCLAADGLCQCGGLDFG